MLRIECYQNIPQTCIDIHNFRIPLNIRLADHQFHVPNTIDMLTDAEIFWRLMCVGQIHENKNQPTLQKAKLSWIIGGRVYNHQPVRAGVCTLSINQQISETLAKFWDMENISFI